MYFRDVLIGIVVMGILIYATNPCTTVRQWDNPVNNFILKLTGACSV